MDLHKMIIESGFTTQAYSERKCTGVVVESILGFFATLVEVCENEGEYGIVVEAMRNVCEDKTGAQTILYWPRIPYSDPQTWPEEDIAPQVAPNVRPASELCGDRGCAICYGVT